MRTKIDIFHHDCTFDEALEVAKKYNLKPQSIDDDEIQYWVGIKIENVETVWFVDREDRDKWEAYWGEK